MIKFTYWFGAHTTDIQESRSDAGTELMRVHNEDRRLQLILFFTVLVMALGYIFKQSLGLYHLFIVIPAWGVFGWFLGDVRHK